MKSRRPETDAERLRRQAEELLGGGTGGVPLEQDATRLLHELQVHQIELELQNEELQHARTELEAALTQYTDLYELAPVGYLTLGRNGKIGKANLTGSRLLGVDRSNLDGRRLALFVAVDVRAAFDAFVAKVFESNASESCEVVVEREDATSVALELTAVATAGLDECRVVALDITSRRHAEAEKRALEASLAQADRLASMGVLAAGIAHEINNPLSYLLHNVGDLARELPDVTAASTRCCAALRAEVGDEAFERLAGSSAAALRPSALKELVQMADDAFAGARRISEISRAFGAFSDHERAKPAGVDIRRAIESALVLAKAEITYRARLVVELERVPEVWGIEGRLSQVFLNLLINAAHSIAEGHVDDNRIAIRTWTEGPNVLTEVSDTGAGIAPEHLQRIFDPFFTTKPVGVGSGLGLAICRTILGDVGGSIRVESQVGRGTRFVVSLPIHPDVPVSKADEATIKAPRSPVSRCRVLVVDDEEPIRRILMRVLGKVHDLTAVASGEEARALLERDPAFDVIVCDLMMPGMTGVDLHAWLANHDSSLAERVIFCTGGAFTPKATEYLARVGNSVLTKPIDAHALLAAVTAMATAARGGGPAK